MQKEYLEQTVTIDTDNDESNCNSNNKTIPYRWSNESRRKLDWSEYDINTHIWDMDAQEYVNQLRSGDR